MITIQAKIWYNNHWVMFSLGIGIYQNIITFLQENNIFFLAEMELNFDLIPLTLHGKGVSYNLLEYLANNSDNNELILRFLDYFIVVISDIRYSSGKLINFHLSDQGSWQNITIDVSGLAPTTTTTTTLIPTTTLPRMMPPISTIDVTLWESYAHLFL